MLLKNKNQHYYKKNKKRDVINYKNLKTKKNKFQNNLKKLYKKQNKNNKQCLNKWQNYQL